MYMKMTSTERKRLRRITIKTLLALCIGLIYTCFIKITGWGIPCVFHLITGLHCPGCGITRMFLALLKLDIVTAARYNLLVLCLLPFAIVLLFYKVWQYVKKGHTEASKAEKIGLIVIFILCVAFFILRNTSWIPFLIMP